MDILFPGDRTCLSIILGKKFQIEYVDDPIIIQIRFSGGRFVIVHPDRESIELIDDIIIVNITGDQSDRWERGCTPISDGHRALGTEEATRNSDHRICPGGSTEFEGTIWIDPGSSNKD